MAKVHSSVNDVLAIDGYIITGNPETGERISLVLDDDQVEAINGTGGESAYSVTNSRKGRITVTVMKSSRTNRKLLALNAVTKGAGTLIPAIGYTDGVDGSTWAASDGLLMKVPDYSVTDGADQTVQWVIVCANLIGGPQGLPDADLTSPADV